MNDLFLEAITALQAGRLDEAEQHYLTLLKDNTDHPVARFNLSAIYLHQGKLEKAAQELIASQKLRPTFGEGWLILCDLSDRLQWRELSLFAGEQATIFLPKNAKAWFQYGLVLSRCERYREAITCYRRALLLDKNYSGAHINLAVVLKQVGDYEQAEREIISAIKMTKNTLSSNAPESELNSLHWHWALLLLTRGNYKDGFAFFRARFQGGTNWQRNLDRVPLWQGEPLSGKTILVNTEQGHGDALMLARYLPRLKERGARVLFAVQEALVPLFQNWGGVDQVIAYGTKPSETPDWVTWIFDLPLRFETNLSSIPNALLSLPLGSPIKTIKGSLDGLKVGVVWKGQVANPLTMIREIPFDQLVRLFKQKNCQFYSLTRDILDAERQQLNAMNVYDCSPQLKDFSDVARILLQLDLLITCDTAAAHLAGCLGIKVWTLLPFVADWRWLLNRNDSPWYATMTLFRQRQRGDWTPVIDQIEKDLLLFVSAQDKSVSLG